jgi:hypothetical protein
MPPPSAFTGRESVVREVSELHSVSNGMEVDDRFFPGMERLVTEEPPRQVTPVKLQGEAAAASQVEKKAVDVGGMVREALNAMIADSSVDEAAWRTAARRRRVRWKGRAGGGMARTAEGSGVSVWTLG